MLLTIVGLALMPQFAAASCSYSEGGYYGEGSYYTQATYQTNFTQSATVVGALSVTGSISKGSGTFVIDHPLDPKNKLLYHSFVESPDAKNLYDGTATLDASGSATIALPGYFDALNTDVRYQVSPVGAPMPALFMHGSSSTNIAVIEGGLPGGQVSWQVTGIRRDPYILEHPITVEIEKGPETLVQKGEILHPLHEDTWLARLLRILTPNP